MVFDSSGGFFLPDGSMLNPDAAYLIADQLAGVTREARARILRVAPAFVIELRSPSDRLAKAQKKMDTWMWNGVQAGWLVDPETRQVHVYEPGATPRIESGSQVAGSGPLTGFVLDLKEVRHCYEI